MNLLRSDLELLEVLGIEKNIEVKFIGDILSKTDRTPKLNIKEREKLIGVIDQLRKGLNFNQDHEDFLLSQLRFELDC